MPSWWDSQQIGPGEAGQDPNAPPMSFPFPQQKPWNEQYQPASVSAPAASSGPPTGGDLHDPAYAAKLVAYYAAQPGANPSLKNDPNYWIQKITSGELGQDVNYIVGKFMTPEGPPAGSPGGFSPDDPSYQWRLQQGLEGVEKSAAARGNLLSGGTLKDLTNYAQGLASTEYGNQFQRQYSLADLGLRGTIAGGGNAGYGTAPGQVYLPPSGQIGPGQSAPQTPAGTSAFSSAYTNPAQPYSLAKLKY